MKTLVLMLGELAILTMVIVGLWLLAFTNAVHASVTRLCYFGARFPGYFARNPYSFLVQNFAPKTEFSPVKFLLHKT